MIAQPVSTLTAGGNGWLAGFLPVAGGAVQLLARQADVIAPVRVAEGPILLAEMPYEKDPSEARAVVESALREGAQAVAGNPPPAPQGDAEAAANLLQTCLEECAVPFERKESQFQLRLEAGAFQQKVACEPRGSLVLLRGDLVRVKEVEPVSEEALAHFLLALNRRLRFARGSIAAGRVAVEVVIPASALRPWLLERALGALAIGAKLARRECAALLDAEIARQYLEFHKRKETTQ